MCRLVGVGFLNFYSLRLTGWANCAPSPSMSGATLPGLVLQTCGSCLGCGSPSPPLWWLTGLQYLVTPCVLFLHASNTSFSFFPQSCIQDLWRTHLPHSVEVSGQGWTPCVLPVPWPAILLTTNVRRAAGICSPSPGPPWSLFTSQMPELLSKPTQSQCLSLGYTVESRKTYPETVRAVYWPTSTSRKQASSPLRLSLGLPKAIK